MNDSATSRFGVLENHAASIVIQIKPKAAFSSSGPEEKNAAFGLICIIILAAWFSKTQNRGGTVVHMLYMSFASKVRFFMKTRERLWSMFAESEGRTKSVTPARVWSNSSRCKRSFCAPRRWGQCALKPSWA